MSTTSFHAWLASQPGCKTAWMLFEERRRDEGLFGDAHERAARIVRRWAQSTPRRQRFAIVPGGSAHG